MITDKNIDDGKPFDRGRISADHARLRGVCPREFYNHILARALQKRTESARPRDQSRGAPRNLCHEGAKWTDAGKNIRPINIPERYLEIPSRFFMRNTA